MTTDPLPVSTCGSCGDDGVGQGGGGGSTSLQDSFHARREEVALQRGDLVTSPQGVTKWKPSRNSTILGQNHDDASWKDSFPEECDFEEEGEASHPPFALVPSPTSIPSSQVSSVLPSPFDPNTLCAIMPNPSNNDPTTLPTPDEVAAIFAPGSVLNTFMSQYMSMRHQAQENAEDEEEEVSKEKDKRQEGLGVENNSLDTSSRALSTNTTSSSSPACGNPGCSVVGTALFSVAAAFHGYRLSADRLALVQEFHKNREMANNVNALKHDIDAIKKEMKANKDTYDRTIQAAERYRLQLETAQAQKHRLEELCRSLNAQRKKELSSLQSKLEEERSKRILAEELSLDLQALQQESEEGEEERIHAFQTLESEFHNIKEKFRYFLEQYDLRERHFHSVVKTKDIQIALLEAKLKKGLGQLESLKAASANALSKSGGRKSLPCNPPPLPASQKFYSSPALLAAALKAIPSLPGVEGCQPMMTAGTTTQELWNAILGLGDDLVTRTWLFAAAFKLLQAGEAVAKQNEMIATFKNQMISMDKRAEALENSLGTNHQALFERVESLADERDEHLATIRKLKMRSERLEGICRALQAERSKLQAEVATFKSTSVLVNLDQQDDPTPCPLPPAPFTFGEESVIAASAALPADLSSDTQAALSHAIEVRQQAFKDYENALVIEHAMRQVAARKITSSAPNGAIELRRKLTPHEEAELLKYERQIQEAVLKDLSRTKSIR